jgi:co-chaperonin GroES (HSP10)
MNSLLFLVLFLAIVQSVLSFTFSRVPLKSFNLQKKSFSSIKRLKTLQNAVGDVLTTESIPEEIKKMQALNDMVLVERISAPSQSRSGLFMHHTDAKDRKQLAKVLSVPINEMTSQSGRKRPVSEMISFKVGDSVYVDVSSMICFVFLWFKTQLS